MSNETSVVPDHADRRRIEADLDVTVQVSAGAGSGKTTQLVARVVELIRRGTPLDAVVVITFTTAAAGTLRTRLRGALEAAAAEDPDPALRVAIDQLETAAICTLHAFARRILGEFPVEAGLPPGFEVVSEAYASVEFDAWWTDTLDLLLTDPDLERAVEVLATFGVRPQNYRAAAAALDANYDRIDPTPHGPGEVPALDLRELLAALDAAVAYREQCVNPDADARSRLEAIAAFAAALRAAANEGERLAILADPPLFTKDIRKAECLEFRAVNEALGAAREALGAAITAVTAPAVDAVTAWLGDAVRGAAETRFRKGRILFHDLLVGARDLVRDNVGVRRVLHDRWRMLLLDEFQDTDPLQIDLATRLSAVDPEVSTESWTDVELVAGRLFTVGDPKQSIYRFRRADVQLFHRAQELLDGQPAALSANFRTRPRILEWVNATVGPLFGPDPDGLQASFLPLEPMRPADPDVAEPVRVFGDVHPKGVRAATVRRAEAEDVVAVVERCRAERWPVEDPTAPTGTRPARLQDIAILLPTRSVLGELERAFDDAGIPLRIESQSLVFATDDVRDLLAVLTAIAYPADDLALVAALRTPLFACSDEELRAYKELGGTWRYTGSTPEGTAESIVDAFAALTELRRHHRWESVDATLDRVIETRGVYELALARPRPREHWRRTRFLVDQAREFADEGIGGLRVFTRWVQEQIELETRALEAVLPDPDDDAVRVLTVHGAKGEEFPVVIVAGLGTAPSTDNPPVLYQDGAPVTFLTANSNDKSLPRIESSDYEIAKDREKRADDAERRRLLYVAVTRARDHLAVSLHRTSGAGKTLAGVLAATVSENLELCHRLDLSESVDRDSGSDPSTGCDPPRTPEAYDADLHRLRTAPAGTVPVTSATGLSREFEPDDEDTPATWRRGRAGTSIGRAVHATMQTVDLRTGADLAAIATAQAAAEGVPDQVSTIVTAAEAMRASPSVRDALALPLRREVPVGAVIEGVFVQGFIDLLVESPEGLVVIDYKTDRAPAETDLDQAVARYAPQAATYALLLEHITGRQVVRAVFVFTRGRQPVERVVEGDVLRSAIVAVRNKLRTHGESGVVDQPAGSGGRDGARPGS